MKRAINCFLATLCAAYTLAHGQATVARKDVDAHTKLETVVSGYVNDLNGRYKLRVSELTFQPGGYVGEHHHLAPGIRVVTKGELTFVQGEKTTLYRPGDAFFEPGTVTHTAHNRGSVPVVMLSFEVLPIDLKGSTQIPPQTK